MWLLPRRAVADGRMKPFVVVRAFELIVERGQFGDSCRFLPEHEIPFQRAIGPFEDAHTAFFVDAAAVPGAAEGGAGVLEVRLGEVAPGIALNDERLLDAHLFQGAFRRLQRRGGFLGQGAHRLHRQAGARTGV